MLKDNIMGQALENLRARRITINLETSLTDSSGAEIKAVVLDLSKNGVRLQVGEPLFVGELLQLQMGRSGYAKVRVLWVAGIEAGGIFLDLH